MFDISFGELLLVGGVAVLVIPPKDWPATLRAAGKALSHVRAWGAEARGMLDDLAKEEPAPKKNPMIQDLEGKWRETYDLSDFLDPSRPVQHTETMEEKSAEPSARADAALHVSSEAAQREQTNK